VTAALVYTVNHGLAKSMLYLVTGAVRSATGSTLLADLGGLVEHDRVLSGAFLIGGLALVGIPPLTGFFSKLLVLDIAARAGSTLALTIAVGGAILTIAYVTRTWNAGFWGPSGERVLGATREPALVGITVVLAATLLVFGVGFDPLVQAAEAAAGAALDIDGYVEAVGPDRFIAAEGGEAA